MPVSVVVMLSAFVLFDICQHSPTLVFWLRLFFLLELCLFFTIIIGAQSEFFIGGVGVCVC